MKKKNNSRKQPSPSQPEEESAKTPAPRFTEAALTGIGKEADSIVIHRYSPPGAVINEEMKVLQFRGHTSPYLEHGQGEASLDLMKMCREGLSVELRTAIQKAKKDNAPAKKEGIRINSGRGGGTPPALVDIEVVPFKAAATKDLCFLVLFKDAGMSSTAGEGFNLTPASYPDDEETTRLQQEPASAGEYLTTVTAEHKAAREELMALNEELQSSNEEMQSINEELETAKEELQSTNEELTTLNDELKSRNEQMLVLNNDLVNVLTGIEIPVILLGLELQIRRFNPSAGKILNLLASDAGRPITDIRTNIMVSDLRQIILGVMDTLSIKQQEIQDTDGRWYSMTIRPYKTVDNRIEGVLMTMIDINELKLIGVEREKLILELKDTLENVKQLSGLLPICATCKKIRDDKGYWNLIESYVTEHSEVLFSHGICPECEKEMLAEIERLKKEAGF